MTPAQTIRFAVAGCGLMGQRHAEILRATPGAVVTVVQDPVDKAACEIAEDARVVGKYDDVLAREDVDAVVLSMPSALHAELGVRAANAGKHVITEKPIDSDPDAAEQLIDECVRAGVICAVISQHRFADGAAALKQAIDRGTLGKPVLARASVKWFRDDDYYSQSGWRGKFRGEGGGVLINQSVHYLDLLFWMLGEPVVIEGLVQRNREVMETEDTAVATMRFAGGTLAVLDASTSAYPGYDERLEIYSLSAACILEKSQIVSWQHEGGEPQPLPPSFSAIAGELDPKLHLFQRQYLNILGAIRGEEELVVKPREALAVVRAIRRIYESSRSRTSEREGARE